MASEDEGELAYSEILASLDDLGAHLVRGQIDLLIARGAVRTRPKTRERTETRYATPLSPEERVVAAARMVVAAIEPALMIGDMRHMFRDHLHLSSEVVWLPDVTEGAQESTTVTAPEPIPAFDEQGRTLLRKRAAEVLRLCAELLPQDR